MMLGHLLPLWDPELLSLLYFQNADTYRSIYEKTVLTQNLYLFRRETCAVIIAVMEDIRWSASTVYLLLVLGNEEQKHIWTLSVAVNSIRWENVFLSLKKKKKFLNSVFFRFSRQKKKRTFSKRLSERLRCRRPVFLYWIFKEYYKILAVTKFKKYCFLCLFSIANMRCILEW